MNHCDKIIDYMRTHGSITQLEATRFIGSTRLSGRIYDLKKRGYNIGSEMVDGRNRDGEPVRYKKYWLVEEPVC